MIFHFLLFIVLCLSIMIQDFIPGFPWAYHSHFHLVAVVFFACAVSVPFPVMLIFAFLTGFIWDAKNLVLAGDSEALKLAAQNLGAVLPKAGGTFGFSIVTMDSSARSCRGSDPSSGEVAGKWRCSWWA